MAVYMIAYDLHDGEDYNDQIEAIQALPSGGSWHNLGSTWFVISKQAAVQIHNSLKRHLLGGDKLAVVSRIRIQDRTGLFEDCPVRISQTPRKYIVLKRGIEDAYVW